MIILCAAEAPRNRLARLWQEWTVVPGRWAGCPERAQSHPWYERCSRSPSGFQR